ncbi:MAG TPA: DUF547 domain-containing protein [Chthoniobacterales bacterium]|nr:DUF547 domain-containing protein [Chthoniobacterales bacterium]
MTKKKLTFLFTLLLATACLSVTTYAQGGGDKKQKDVEVKVPSGIDHSAFDRLLKKHVDEKGLVNYSAWKNSEDDMEALDGYLKQFAPKADKPAEGMEKAASLTNAYNAIAIRTVLNAYPIESIHELEKPFEAKNWTIGAAKVSLNDIENGTLRPQLKYRAHSVLVCAARSCPPLQRTAYKADSFEEQSDAAYTTWLAREDLNQFMPKENEAKISEVFKWFKGDFDKSLTVPKVIAQYGPPPANELTKGGDKFEVGYLSYNWGVNDQGEHGRNYSKVNLIFDKLGD